MNNRVVVTGLGIISSIGTGKTQFWGNLVKGTSGISPAAAFDTSQHTTHVAGEVKSFITPKEHKKKHAQFYGRASLMAIDAAKQAVEDAGLTFKEIKKNRVGVCMGTTMGEVQVIESLNGKWVANGETGIECYPIYQALPYNISAVISLNYGLSGKNRLFTTACAAGNYAVDYCFELLQKGEIDIAIAGGSDAISRISFTGFNKVGATAPEKCQPFDKNRKGMIPAEGCGILVLELLDSAIQRGAPVYAEILGCGFSCDAHHMTQPEADGITRCIKDALDRTGISPGAVDYICAHGTGTVQNDKAESAAITAVFGRKVPVSSLKSMLGHTMGAASAIEAAACCMAIKNGVIPPTINYETIDPECDIDCVPNAARRQDLNIVLNNAFAFGGNNSCLVIGKYKQ